LEIKGGEGSRYTKEDAQKKLFLMMAEKERKVTKPFLEVCRIKQQKWKTHRRKGGKIGECVNGRLFPIFPMNHIKAVEDVEGERRAWTHIELLD
jgi:hypothetical protein